MITDGTAVQHGCGHVGSRQKTIVWLPYRMMPSSQCHRTAREAPRPPRRRARKEDCSDSEDRTWLSRAGGSMCV
jgi:hypothetical protein